jgi:hypothetical protein
VNPRWADIVLQQQARECAAGELAALVGVKDVRFSMAGPRLGDSLDAEFDLQSDG